MSKREGENQELVSVYVDGSLEYHGQYKEVSALLPPEFSLFI